MEFFERFFSHLFDLGVTQAVVCPGARNSYLLRCIEKLGNFRIFFHAEERSASFFSLGQNQAYQGLSSLVLVTSGTAVSECYSAVIEAHYQKLPLLVISADRPKGWGYTGAPQTIFQRFIFGEYAKYGELDYDRPLSDSELANFINQMRDVRGPLHINCYLPDPRGRRHDIVWNKKGLATSSALASFESPSSPCPRKPLIIVGPITHDHDKAVVETWFNQFDSQLDGYPIVVEASSNLPERRRCFFVNKWLKRWVDEIEPDGIIKIGGTPLSDIWRDLEDQEIGVWNFSSTGYPGMARSSAFIGGIGDLFLFSWDFAPMAKRDWMGWEQRAQEQFEFLMRRYPNAEWSWVRRISESIDDCYLYLGNSLPIREFDWISYRAKPKRVWSYRGVNGIDGQLSGFWGWASGLPPQSDAVAVVGDLTAFYDLQSLWLFHRQPQLFSDKNLVMIILNNQGGHIFRSYLQYERLVNDHSLNFQSWAEMFQIDYQQWRHFKDFALPRKGLHVIEIFPDLKEQIAMEKEWSLWRE
ncbi:MAG: thiamine pyrophosphate-binding protein [Bdellovibrionaceae bacterium]|nr:thiamine pyrophosphate-binding protein [Pseudobdellovibrionaceae bacterium]MDW8189725.1 thiamine pyrophosphate-binding protein [Pseudobdellovibrionaceae bacterium]